MPATQKYRSGISGAAAGTSPASIVSHATVINTTTDGAGPHTGDFTVGAGTNWVYVWIFVRWGNAVSLSFSSVTLGGVTVNQVAATTSAQFTPNLWLGKCKVGATGSQQLSVTMANSGSTGMAAVCAEVADAHESSPDGTPQVNSPGDNGDASSISDALTAAADGLAFFGACFDGGDTDPLDGNNGTTLLRQGATGSNSTNDAGWFLGSKATGAGGALTLGCDAAVSDDWASILTEVLNTA